MEINPVDCSSNKEPCECCSCRRCDPISPDMCIADPCASCIGNVIGCERWQPGVGCVWPWEKKK